MTSWRKNHMTPGFVRSCPSRPCLGTAPVIMTMCLQQIRIMIMSPSILASDNVPPVDQVRECKRYPNVNNSLSLIVLVIACTLNFLVGAC